MRACYLSELAVLESYQLRGPELHHLVNVIRLEVDEELLLLNGKGLKVKTKVVGVSKKEVALTKLSHEVCERSYVMDLALGIPKKDALDLSLKQAVELGFRKIFVIRSDYSQTKLPEADRIHSLLTNALEQSNAPFLPEVIAINWEELPVVDYPEIYFLDSQGAHQASKKQNEVLAPRLLIVGPEGGFSEREVALFRSWNSTVSVHLPSPILRTPTAVAAGAGFVLKTLLD